MDETQATIPSDEGEITAPHVLVDRYEVGPLLGRGGVGQVHEALDTRTGVKVAIKFVLDHIHDRFCVYSTAPSSVRSIIIL